MKDYIMFMFGEHQEQDKFVKLIANELSVIAQSEDIRFYYGQTSTIYTFKSDVSFDDITEYLFVYFGHTTELVYILLPYSKDAISIKLPEDVYQYLFGVNNNENKLGFNSTMQESQIDDINFTFKNELNFIRILNEDDEDDDIAIMRPKNIELSMDEILDKISEKGMSSLTKKEIDTLEKYSKTI